MVVGVRILEGNHSHHDRGRAVLYCSTAGVAFGPLFEDGEEAEAFLQFLGPDVDPRLLSPKELRDRYTEFCRQVESREAAGV